MSALYQAGAALGLSESQLQALLYFWNCPKLLESIESLKQDLKSQLFLSDKLIYEFCKVLQDCNEDRGFNYQRFCESLWTEDRALDALALLQFFQQRFFTKGSHKEECLTKPGEFTQEHGDAIKALVSEQFGLLGDKPLSTETNVTFMIGATARTCQHYWQRYFEERKQHNLGQLYVFMSTRPLKDTVANDNPVSTESFSFPGEPGQTYIDYLQARYLERYNRFMSLRYGPAFSRISHPCEALAMLERYEALNNKPFEQAIEEGEFTPVYTCTQNSPDFYTSALLLATETKHLTDNGRIALGCIQPYTSRFETQLITKCRELARKNSRFGFLTTVSAHAYGASGVDKPEILAQCLAVMVDTAYPETAITLSENAKHNVSAHPKRVLSGNYTPEPLAFFVSSMGDVQLALDAARLLAANKDRECVFLPMTKSARDFLEKQNLPANIKVNSLDSISLVNAEDQNEFNKSQIDTLNEYLVRHDFKQAFIGMPSPLSEAKALQLAAKIKIPCIFAYEYLFTPPTEHKLWQYREDILANPKTHAVVPTSDAKSHFPQASVIGHRSLEVPPSTPSRDDIHDIKQQLQLAEEESLSLAVLSGSTQPHETDLEFYEAILQEAKQHPNVKLRISIHPGVADLTSYLEKLISACERAELGEQIKIILNDGIKNKLDPNTIKRFTSSRYILDANINGNQAAMAADRIAQAVPGGLINSASMQGRVAYFHKGDTHLPKSWFADCAASFFENSKQDPHSVSDLDLDSEVSPACALSRLMLSS